jgi:CheY-like chemotaxis protein
MHKKRILIVEDRDILADLEKEILEREGFEVEIAMDGVEGLERIKSNVYDVIVSDFQMPQMRGDEFYLEVRRLNQGLEKRIIFISANISGFMESTGNRFLAKPFSCQELIEVVKDLVTSLLL